ncbi:MAG: metallophosphoesterase [Bacteroidota bacterium]
MKIVAISDIHAAYDNLYKIIQKEGNADVILIVGDITTHGTVADIRNAVGSILTLGKSVLAIAGNMDIPESDDELLRLDISLNARGVRIGDVGFFGVSAAALSRLHTPYELTEEEISCRIESGFSMVRDAPIKVFVPHSPPFRTKLDRIFLGTHVGSTAIREFIEHEQPDVVVCGHIHEARGQDILGKTKMVNCGAAQRGFYAQIIIEDKILIENLQLD